MRLKLETISDLLSLRRREILALLSLRRREDHVFNPVPDELLFEIMEETLDPIAEKLLTHVVLGEQDEAEAILKENPSLLLMKSKATDCSGRPIIYRVPRRLPKASILICSTCSQHIKLISITLML